MRKEDILKRCETLGIDTKGLTTNALLEEAIAKKEAELQAEQDAIERAKLNTVAEYFGIEVPTEINLEALKALIAEAIKPIEKEVKIEKIIYKDLSEKPTEKKKERELPTYEYKGKKYTFKKTTPNSLRVLGTVYSLEELVKNNDAMKFLIVGNSFFIEPLI